MSAAHRDDLADRLARAATGPNALQRALLPCPHCGGPPKLTPMPRTADWWRVRCEDYDCGATTWAMIGTDAATQAWNRRGDGKA